MRPLNTFLLVGLICLQLIMLKRFIKTKILNSMVKASVFLEDVSVHESFISYVIPQISSLNQNIKNMTSEV